MFYSIIVFIFVIIFLLKTNHDNLPSRCIIALLISYMMALFFLALYLSKDSYYYNTANHYFSLPKYIWKALLLLSIRKSTVIRFCNLFVLSVIFCSVLFALSFLQSRIAKIARRVKITVAILLLLELAVYDPSVIKYLYCFLYPRFLTVPEFSCLQSGIHTCTMLLNTVLILLCIVFLFFTITQTAGLRMIRLNILWVTLSYLFIMLTFAYIFLRYPSPMVKISKLSGIITFLPAPLSSNSLLYTLFPFFIIFTLLLITVSIYKSNVITRQLREKDFSISKQIAASDITSRTFCHYMKNELLAISAELDNLDLNEESRKAVQNVVERCDHLYQRLDIIHRSTHAAVLVLQKEDPGVVITEMVKQYLSQYPDIQVTCQFTEDCPQVLIDRNYFEQAIMNILTNAVEALAKVPPQRRFLFLSLDSVDNWTVLTIRDTGIGIPKEQLSNIFTPFYTSEPVARHWGIGLSLTHKIITAHEGHIEVSSIPDTGTTFQIMLPAVQ